MKKLAEWLQEHAVVPGESIKAIVAFIISLIVVGLLIMLCV